MQKAPAQEQQRHTETQLQKALSTLLQRSSRLLQDLPVPSSRLTACHKTQPAKRVLTEWRTTPAQHADKFQGYYPFISTTVRGQQLT